MDAATDVAPDSVIENRTMEESYSERLFNIKKHKDYLVKSHDSHCCIFHKNLSPVWVNKPCSIKYCCIIWVSCCQKNKVTYCKVFLDLQTLVNTLFNYVYKNQPLSLF